MDILIKPEINTINQLDNDSILGHDMLALESKQDVEENLSNKVVTDNCDFITINNSSEKVVLGKSELEISTSEFIIDEDNYNISPNTSSDPCVDPLAIDDFSAEEVSSSLNDSQYNLTKDNIIYIVDVDDIKDNSVSNPKINSIKLSSLEDIHNKINRNIKDVDGNNLNLMSDQNLQKSTANNDENEMPSDGSDSGLGLESNLLQIEKYHKLHNTIGLVDKNILYNPDPTKIPTKSSLKRKSDTLEDPVLSLAKRGKKSIQFDNVKIFYFPRIQGFCCVPSQGGCTLGMGAKHVQSKTYKLSEHVNEQNGDDKLSLQLCNAKGSSSDETDSDEDLSEENISDLDPDSSGFLQPVPVKSRRALLKAAGIKKIDSTEKNECRAIRSSREYCGCLCRGFCDPDTCSCSQSGIKCQVDRLNFPCGCNRDGCANIHGRVEFNPSRVRTHFIHTIMRLEIENKSKSTFIHEIPATQRYFPNSNPVDVIYGGESSSMIQNSIQFFPDSISIANNDNFDLFPLHNGGENPRITLSSSESEINVDGELSYPVLKSFLSPTNNYQEDEPIDSSKSSKVSLNNNSNIKSSTSACSDNENNSCNESRFLSNYAHGYDSFSSAYANFLEEAYLPSKVNFTEKIHNEISELASSNSNYNQNQLEASPVHDLLNINRNISLPLYPTSGTEVVPKNSQANDTELNNSPDTNLENDSSITKICTLAPTGHTSTSIFEGTSTTVASNYISSSCSFETKDNLTSTTDCNSTPVTNSISKCDFSELNSTEISTKKLNENVSSDDDLETVIPLCDFKDENISPPFSPPPILVTQENCTKTLETTNAGSDIIDTKDEIKKQYQSFNLTNCCNDISPTINNNNNDDINGNLFNVSSTTNVDLLKDII